MKANRERRKEERNDEQRKTARRMEGRMKEGKNKERRTIHGGPSVASDQQVYKESQNAKTPGFVFSALQPNKQKERTRRRTTPEKWKKDTKRTRSMQGGMRQEYKNLEGVRLMDTKMSVHHRDSSGRQNRMRCRQPCDSQQTE